MPELRYPDPPLADDLIRLRPWREADIKPAHLATLDPLIPRFTSVPANQSEEDVRRFFEGQEPSRAAGEALTLAIADAASDALVGVIVLVRLDWEHRRGEIGYWVAPWGRRRGAATRAVRMLSRWALHELGLGRVELRTDTDNEASQGVAARCGFQREGILRAYERRADGRHDLVVFSLLPADLG